MQNQEYKYALVEFCDPADALKALQIPKLSLAGKKLTIKPKILPNKKIQSPGDVASPQKEATGSESMQGVLNDSDILQFSEVSNLLVYYCICLHSCCNALLITFRLRGNSNT